MAKRDSGCGSCEIPVAYKDIRDSDERMAEESASPRASREVSVWASGKWGSTIDFSGFWGHENASSISTQQHSVLYCLVFATCQLCLCSLTLSFLSARVRCCCHPPVSLPRGRRGRRSSCDHENTCRPHAIL